MSTRLTEFACALARRARFPLFAGMLGLELSATSSAALDASRAHSFIIGPGLNSTSGTGFRSDVSATRFPRSPGLVAHTRLADGIGQAPTSDVHGNLIVAHGTVWLSKLDPQEHVLWTRRIEAEAVSQPLITSDGSIIVITRLAKVIRFSPSGAELERHALPITTSQRDTLAIPLSNGGALVASGADLVELNVHGEVVRQGHLEHTIISLNQLGTHVLAVLDNGLVAEALVTGDFRIVGSFGGAVKEAVAARDDKLFAVVDERELIAFDLDSRASHRLARDATSILTGPPTLFGNGSIALVADGGTIVIYESGGGERLRVPLLNIAGPGPAAELPPASMIGDTSTALIAVRAGSDALALGLDGRAVHLAGSACLAPFRPTPTPDGVVLACRSGQLFTVAEKTP